MKKYTAIMLAAFTLLLAACSGKQTEFDIAIVVPAKTTEGVVYSHEEISPLKDILTISSGEGLGDTEVVLKPIEVKEENAYDEPAYLTPGMSAKMEVEKGAWFKIGVNVQNTTEEDVVVYVRVEDAEVRISSEENEKTEEKSFEETEISDKIADEKTEAADRKPMIMVDGILYLDTGYESEAEARCGMMDGEITSTVDGTEIPTENNQSNFGTGYGYQYGTEGTIETNMDGKWWIFATEEAQKDMSFISENEQLATSSLPNELYKLCGYPEQGEMEAVDANSWGIILSAENVTSGGMTLIVSQSGGAPTGELQYGSDFILKVWKDGTWEELPYIVEGDVAWTMEAYRIPMEGCTEQEIVWEHLYGNLPGGKYLLSKSFMDFRGTGDYDTETYIIEFEIE